MERKYLVKRNWIFQLESMHDKLACIEMDVEEGKLNFPFEIAGKMISDFDDLSDLMSECSTLEWTAKRGRVTGKEYGRIKAIAEWRMMNRYIVCLNSGMSEQDAGMCFID